MQQQYTIHIPNKQVDGILHKTPQRDKLCIIVHGFEGSKDDFVIRELAFELQKNGISSFRPDLVKKTNKNGFDSFDLVNEVQSLHACISYFRKEYKQVILIGGSMGGLVSLLSALDNKHISRIILINPFLYLFGNVAWKYRKLLLLALLSCPFNKRVRSTFSYYATRFHPQHLSIPTLIICSKADNTVHYTQSITFSKQLKTSYNLIIDNYMDHALTKKRYITTAVSHIVQWLT